MEKNIKIIFNLECDKCYGQIEDLLQFGNFAIAYKQQILGIVKFNNYLIFMVDSIRVHSTRDQGIPMNVPMQNRMDMPNI